MAMIDAWAGDKSGQDEVTCHCTTVLCVHRNLNGNEPIPGEDWSGGLCQRIKRKVDGSHTVVRPGNSIRHGS